MDGNTTRSRIANVIQEFKWSKHYTCCLCCLHVWI